MRVASGASFPPSSLSWLAVFGIGWFLLFAVEFKQLGKHIAASAGFVSNLVFWSESGYFDTVAETKPLLHVWSLSIEEQFYLIWPVLLWVVAKRRVNPLSDHGAWRWHRLRWPSMHCARMRWRRSFFRNTERGNSCLARSWRSARSRRRGLDRPRVAPRECAIRRGITLIAFAVAFTPRNEFPDGGRCCQPLGAVW